MVSLLDEAPVDTVVNTTHQWIFMMVFSIALLVAMVSTLRDPIRRSDWTEVGFRALIFVGSGLMAIVVEPAIDRMGGLWYSGQGGVWSIVQLFGITIPVWVVPCYMSSIGWLIIAATDRLRRGATAMHVWQITGFIFVANLLVEMPILWLTRLYTYYGSNQPLFSHSWFPVPGWYYTTNVVFVLVPAFLLAMIARMNEPRLRWLTPVVVLSGGYAGYALVAWPTIAALNSGVGGVMGNLIGLATMVLGFVAIYLAGRWAPLARDKSVTVHPETPLAVKAT